MTFLHKHLLPALVLTLCSSSAFGWAETDDDDLVIDAPWRTIRNYVPVLFFAPELEGYSVIQMLSIYNYDQLEGRKGSLIFRDSNPARVGGNKSKPLRLEAPEITAQYPPQHKCRQITVNIIDPHGRPRGYLGLREKYNSFWHYIVRVPKACLGLNSFGSKGVHYIQAEMQVDQMEEFSRPKKISKVLRIVVDDEPFPKFDRRDRHYDVHIHTIAEQTTRDASCNLVQIDREDTCVDAARKVFGGPIAMVLDSAYALGLVDTKFNNANWSAFRDIIATTDHNNFFSSEPYDSASKPGYGPTAEVANGGPAEHAWYRQHFGTLGAEEVAVTGAGNDFGFRGGSHYLMYGAPHIEGPWHGGSLERVLTDEIDFADLREVDIWNFTLGLHLGLESPHASIDQVHRHAASTNGFGYAAHPYSDLFGWPSELTRQAIGYDPRVSRLNAAGDDFIFKGLQLWNGIADYIPKRDLKARLRDFNVFLASKFPYAVNDELNPFKNHSDIQAVLRERAANNGCIKDLDDVSTDQKFISMRSDCYPRDGIPDYMQGVEKGLQKYYDLLSPLLTFSFQNGGGAKDYFVRKLYIAAATDAHGDFNYLTSSSATLFAEAEIGIVDETVNDIQAAVRSAGRRLGLEEEAEKVANAFSNLDGTIINMSSIDSNAFGRVRTYMLASERIDDKHVPLISHDGQLSTDGRSRGFSTKKLKTQRMPSQRFSIPRKPKSAPPSPDGKQAAPAPASASDTTMVQAYMDFTKDVDPIRAASVAAYRDGNTVLTDNPICKISIDANCRLYSGKSAGGWHDGQCAWENADGEIGGDGKLDGGKTALVVRNQRDAMANTIWKDIASYEPFNTTTGIDYDLVQVMRYRNGNINRSRNIGSGPQGKEHVQRLGGIFDDMDSLPASAGLPQALLLKGATTNGHCISNPIWVAPVDIQIDQPASGCPIAPGQLNVTLDFPMTMDATLAGVDCAPDTSGQTVGSGAVDCPAENYNPDAGPNTDAYTGIKVLVQALDRNGRSVDQPTELTGNRVWSNRRVDVGAAVHIIRNGRLTVSNDKSIPCGTETWDATRHRASATAHSYALIANEARDMHGNTLNAIGKTLTMASNGPTLVLPSIKSTTPPKSLRKASPPRKPVPQQ